MRFSRTREVVETLVVESREDRGEVIELRAAEWEEEARRREPCSSSLRRSCSLGDIVATGSCLRVDGDFHGFRKKDIDSVAD